MIALIVGTGVLGSEIDDGTVVHILTKPLPRREIILTKLAVAAAVTIRSPGPAVRGGLIAGSAALALALVVAAALGALAYSALFLALSLLTRRPVLLGLVYVLIWEGLLGNLLSGTRCCPSSSTVSIADRLAPTDLIAGQVSVGVPVMAALFAVGFTALAVHRLRSFSVAGETS